MGENGVILGLVGSPNREGRTDQLVRAALEGASRAGAATELVQMADHVVAACKDCIPWVCRENLQCTYKDEAFELLSEKILHCGALVVGTPIYWWDTSGMVKYLILKMFRVYASSAPLQGLPAFGISIAGGSGNGSIAGLRPVYNFFQVMQMRAVDPVPVTRFNFNAAKKRAETLGKQIAGMAKERVPFSSLEERLLWYDELPYLQLTRYEKRRLLAGQIVEALPEGSDLKIARGLARADALSAAGRQLDALVEITRVYESGVKAFENS